MATVSNFSSHDRQYNDGHMMHMPRFLGIRSPSPTLVIAPTLESYNRRRPFELDDIAFRIRDVDGRTLPFSAVARLHRADDYAMRLKFAANGGLVERFYSKAKVIKISPFNAWRRATGPSQLAVNWHKVNQRSAGPQLHQTYGILSALDRTSQHIAIKVKHADQIHDAQYQVINFANANHASIIIESIAARSTPVCPPDTILVSAIEIAPPTDECEVSYSDRLKNTYMAARIGKAITEKPSSGFA